MAKENRTRFAVLGMLHYGSMTGYEIRKRINEMVGYFWQEPNASLYPALKALEIEGSVIAARELPSSGPSRIRYTLTDLGRAAFAAWIVVAPAPSVLRNEFALKLVFGSLTDPDTILRFIRDEQRNAQEVEASLKAAIGSLPQGQEALMWRLIADYGRTIAESTAVWCERARMEVEALGPRPGSV